MQTINTIYGGNIMIRKILKGIGVTAGYFLIIDAVRALLHSGTAGFKELVTRGFKKGQEMADE